MGQLTKQNQQQLLDDFFHGKLDIKNLSNEQYQFYYDNLVEVESITIKAEFLFFESGSAYYFSQGSSVKSFNSKKQIIRIDYGINTLKRIYVGDNLLDYLLQNHDSNALLYTNIDSNTSLFKVIKKQMNVFLPILTVIDYPSIFRDLCGIIEMKSHDNLANDKFFSSVIAKQTFADSLRDIEERTQYYPPLLKSLFYLFHILNY